MKLDPKALQLLQKANEGSQKFLRETEALKTKPVKETVEENITNPAVEDEIDPEYPYTMKIRNNIIHFRGWKVKDVRLYKSAETSQEQKEALIYNLIKEPVTLDSYESLYALVMIRQKSVDEPIKYHFKCSKCEELYDVDINLDQYIFTDFKEYQPFTVNNHTYQFQDLKNREFYESLEKSDLMDMCMHVKSIDNNDSYSLEEVTSFFEDLDIKEFREIKKHYDEQRFTVTMHGKVKCSHCNNEVEMLFDTLPNFIPPEFEE